MRPQFSRSFWKNYEIILLTNYPFPTLKAHESSIVIGFPVSVCFSVIPYGGKREEKRLNISSTRKLMRLLLPSGYERSLRYKKGITRELTNVPKSALQKADCGCSGTIDASQVFENSATASKPTKSKLFIFV